MFNSPMVFSPNLINIYRVIFLISFHTHFVLKNQTAIAILKLAASCLQHPCNVYAMHVYNAVQFLDTHVGDRWSYILFYLRCTNYDQNKFAFLLLVNEVLPFCIPLGTRCCLALSCCYNRNFSWFSY